MSTNISRILNSRVGEKDTAQGNFLEQVRRIANESLYDNKDLGRIMVAAESKTNAKDAATLMDTTDALLTDLAQAGNASGVSLESHQLKAGAISSLLATNPKEYFSAKLTPSAGADGVVMQDAGFSTAGREISTESYNESDIRAMKESSIMYNISVSGQDDFGSAFFAPVIMDTGVTGIDVTINLSLVYDALVRSTSGALAQFGRRNLIRGYVNPDILTNELTRLYPVFRENGPGANKDKFVDTTVVPVRPQNLGSGVVVNTAPLKVGEEFDIMGLGQRNDIINSGMMDTTDTLSPAARLEVVYVTFGQDTYAVNVYDTPGSIFVAAQQGDTRKMNLIFDTTSATINRHAPTVLGTAPVETVIADRRVRFTLSVHGSVTLDTGRTRISADGIKFVSAENADGTELTEVEIDAVKDFIEAGVVIGYDLETRYENLNLRQNGQLLEHKSYKLVVPVPYLSPISVLSSTYEGITGPELQLAELTSAANMRASHSAVNRLEQANRVLESYVDVKDRDGANPELNCIGSYYVLPAYTSEEIDFADIVDSTRSGNRDEDAKLALLGRLHTHIIDLLVRSEYVTAGMKITGNPNFRPTVVIGTDQQIASYLTPEFGTEINRKEYDLKIVSSVNKRVRGKIYISFSASGNGNDSEVNPLSFGNFIYSPELVSNMNKSFNGQTSRVLTVSPRWLHIWNLPVLGLVHLTNVPDISKKIPINVKDITPTPVTP